MSKKQNSRGKAWRRYKNYSKAKRKRDIDYSLNAGHTWFCPWYNNLHQYSDNKIHCSCPMCSTKTKNKGARHPFYGSTYNPTMMDARRQLSMDDDYLEYFDDID